MIKASVSALLLAAAPIAPAAPPSPPFWHPSPLVTAPDPNEAVKKAADSEWQDIAPEDLLVLDFKDGSRTVIALAPAFAPVHVANIRAFARAGWWKGAAVYRVQDNYVAQWGLNEEERPLPPGVVKLPPAEYERPLAGLPLRPLGYPDSYAASVGHADGWPVAWDPDAGTAWLPHCYGMVGVSRDLAPDTGTGGELYAVIGHAPRHLDRNIALVGRVIDGMDALSALPRGTEALGFYKDRSQAVPIARIALAADLPPAERPAGYQLLRTEGAAFASYVLGRANRGGAFFTRPVGGVDVCNAMVPVRVKPSSAAK